MTIQTDASTLEGSTLQWNLDKGKWSKKEQVHHINVLGLMAVKFAILTSLNLAYLTIHTQTYNKVAPSISRNGRYTQSRAFKSRAFENQQVNSVFGNSVS